MREVFNDIKEKEAQSANVLIRNIDEIDSDEDNGWKDLVEYLVHNVLEHT